MSERWARNVLTAYRVIGTCLYPFVGTYVRYRTLKGKEDRQRRNERYGKTNIARPDGPLIWVHAASVGETTAIMPLVERLACRDITVLLTTGTMTSAKLVADHMGSHIIHQFVPLDLKPAVERFLNHWKPDLAVTCESEIWPTTIQMLGARQIPQVLVNGRLSDRSFAAWKKRSAIAEALFSNFSHVVAQSELDAERFRALGARPVTVSGNLKVDSAPPPIDKQELARILNEIGPRKRWAAVSTHEGEEEICAQVHKMLTVRHPDLLTIVVPRHPVRGDELETMFMTHGLKVARQSRGDIIEPDTAIFMGDTIGDMGLYLRLTDIAFVGKSLVGEGGHNPLEPAMLNTAVLSGSNVQSFRDSYQRLIKNGGARLVKDREMLAGAVNFLFNNPKHLKVMIAAGLRTVLDMRGSLERTVLSLEPFIQPLLVQAQLTSAAHDDAKNPKRLRRGD